MCQWQDALIQSEGGYDPHRWAEWAEGYCSWGMNQNYVCGSQGWSHATAKYIYHVLHNRKPPKDYERLKKYAYFLDGEWQIENIMRRMEAGYTHRRCKMVYPKESYVFQGTTITRNEVCSIRQNNWNGGINYVNRIVNKFNELY